MMLISHNLQEDVKKWIRKDFPICQNWLIREKNEIVTCSILCCATCETTSDVVSGARLSLESTPGSGTAHIRGGE